MQFKLENKVHPNLPKYADVDFQLAQKFGEKIHQELGEFLKAAVLFGSASRSEKKIGERDIDVLLLINDLTMMLNEEVIEAYRVIVQNTASKISKRLHITTMKLTNFWDYVKNADPLVVNMLRDGIPLYDAGIFGPAQQLLFQGRLAPTKESIWAYYARAPNTIASADWHVLQGALDLYWAVVDASHAALMMQGELSPSPQHLAESIQKKLVPKKLVSKKIPNEVDFFVKLSKKITHREIQRLTGKEYEEYRNRAVEVVKELQKAVARR
ncbi:hypothetical protein HYV79_03405 [Candidatus Woesearchaeota archaeon]|nr:hypothetical protein [Candidatus Woesearchaeota archaeon]